MVVFARYFHYTKRSGVFLFFQDIDMISILVIFIKEPSWFLLCES
jgi:hypothetical protein